MITRTDKPVFRSSITEVSYDSYERALHAEQLAEAEALRGPLFTVIWTRAAAVAWNTLDKFNRRERQIRMAMESDLTLTAEKCRFAVHQPFEHLIYDKSYHLDMILNMRNNVKNGANLMGEFIQKFYPSLYTAYFAHSDLISPIYGLVGIYSRVVDDMARYSTPVVHLEEILVPMERYHKIFLNDYDISVL
ncbi:MAG: hypothetical protein NC489_07935 [Ruminococcus flavefaciens]|nr:hypothetical protein [Ruminococcus flavefaciens]